MKKSTLLFIASVLSCVIGITAANVKLKSEYDKKNITSYFKDIPIPPFHHIKEMVIVDSAGFSNLEINISASDTFRLQKTFYDDIEKNVHFEVSNDTLYISMKKPFTQGYTSLNILCNNLQSIEVRHSRIFINNFNARNLQVNTNNVAFLKMQHCEINRLLVQGKNNGSVLIADKCIIDSGFFQMNDKSLLSLDNNEIRYKEFSLSNEATLCLKGALVKEFTSTHQK